MNPLTNVRNIAQLNENDLKNGIFDHNLTWHSQYKDSAYIFIGGLPYDLTEGDVLCVFSQYGEIVDVNLVRDKKSGKSKGYGFLCYEDQRSTILAVDNFNNIKLGGRTIRVDHVSEYRAPKGDEKDEDGKYKIKEGTSCAPKTPSPIPTSDDEIDIKSKKKKKKEKKKKKKKLKEKMMDDNIFYKKSNEKDLSSKFSSDYGRNESFRDYKNKRRRSRSTDKYDSKHSEKKKRRSRSLSKSPVRKKRRSKSQSSSPIGKYKRSRSHSPTRKYRRSRSLSPDRKKYRRSKSPSQNRNYKSSNRNPR